MAQRARQAAALHGLQLFGGADVGKHLHLVFERAPQIVQFFLPQLLMMSMIPTPDREALELFVLQVKSHAKPEALCPPGQISRPRPRARSPASSSSLPSRPPFTHPQPSKSIHPRPPRPKSQTPSLQVLPRTPLVTWCRQHRCAASASTSLSSAGGSSRPRQATSLATRLRLLCSRRGGLASAGLGGLASCPCSEARRPGGPPTRAMSLTRC